MVRWSNKGAAGTVIAKCLFIFSRAAGTRKRAMQLGIAVSTPCHTEVKMRRMLDTVKEAFDQIVRAVQGTNLAALRPGIRVRWDDDARGPESL